MINYFTNIKWIITVSLFTSFEIHMDTLLYNVDDVLMRGQAPGSHTHTGHQQNAPGRGLQPLDDCCHDNGNWVVFRITIIEESENLLGQIQTLLFLNTSVRYWKTQLRVSSSNVIQHKKTTGLSSYSNKALHWFFWYKFVRGRVLFSRRDKSSPF